MPFSICYCAVSKFNFSGANKMTTTLKIIAADPEHGVSSDAQHFKILAESSSGKPFLIGGVSKKVNGWHWHALGRAGRSASHPDFEHAARAAQHALGSKIQFEEVTQ